MRASDVARTLDDLQSRLGRHFQALRAARDRTHPGAPVFALEHGLTPGDLAVLNDSVSGWIKSARPTQRLWLAFVVYATEIGYRYEGDMYWPTLEASTPGWDRHGDREFVSRWFRQFASDFGGAIPQGRWASHFRRICWPITHAVLPVDLQRQFARLLYDYRGALTGDLLADPAALGAALAARTSHTSRRFQQFAENVELLGHVGAALLSTGGSTAALLDSTLHRIVEDLSAEREARTWLRAAKRSADRVRMVGAGRDRDSPQGGTGKTSNTWQRPTAPVVLTVRYGSEGWQLRLRVPDFTPLFERHSDMAGFIRDGRVAVAGFNGPPRAPGWLMHPGTVLRLHDWPGLDNPLFILERGDAKANGLLADECRTPPSTPWLFRLDAGGVGRLVLSAAVHPGRSYLVLGDDLTASPAEWISPQPSACGGASALRVDVPYSPSADDLALLRAIGCASVTEVAVDPVGVSPSDWDGEGFGEWLAGDEPLLMVSTSHPILSCSFQLDETESVVAHLTDERRAFVQLTDIKPGWHRLRMSFLVDQGAVPVPDAALDVRIREPEPSNEAGSFRDPLQIRVSPLLPTLEELWEDRCHVEIGGPYGATASIAFSLRTADGVAASHRFGPVSLPLDPAAWRRTFAEHLRARRDMQAAYDEATAGVIEVSDPELGVAALEAARSFAPLRFGYRRRASGLSLVLHDAADTGSVPVVMRSSFTTPDVTETARPGADGEYGHPEGGLFEAFLGEYRAIAVLPAPVHDLVDARRAAPALRLGERERSANDLLHLVSVAERWRLATIPGDPFAELACQKVRDALVRRACSLVGGAMWASIEAAHARGERLALDRLDGGLARPGDHAVFRQRVMNIAALATDEEVIDRLGEALGPAKAPATTTRLISSRGTRARPGPGSRFAIGGRWLAEYLLRLASDPGSVLAWSHVDNRAMCDEILRTPIALRAARMIVLASNQEWVWE